MGHVLITGPSEQLLTRTKQLLEEEGLQVTQCVDLPARLDPTPDLVLLNGMSGLSDLRRRFQTVPVLLIVPPGTETNEFLLALRPEADDYMPHSVEPQQVFARLKQLLVEQPLREQGPSRLQRPGVTIDPNRHEVRVEGELVRFTPTEFNLLRGLATYPGRVFTRTQLIRFLSGPDAAVTERAIDAHIRTIRKKLAERRNLIETVRGIGYRFLDEGEVPSPKRAGSQLYLIGSSLTAGAVALQPGKEITIGRSTESSVTLAHPSVSRVHATFFWKGDAIWIRDESTNGTLVNTDLLKGEAEIKDGDRIEIGPFNIRLRRLADESAVQRELMFAEESHTPHKSSRRLQVLEEGGAFHGLELVQFCQLLTVRRRDGLLGIEGLRERGHILFFAGTISRAECGEAKGDEAVRALLLQEGGTYLFTPNPSPVGETTRMGSIYDLMERTQTLLRKLEQELRSSEDERRA